jgi:hypothetical protein
MRALRIATLVIALAGTGAAHADAPKGKPLSPAHAEQLLAFFDELVDVSVKNAADCPALAAAVDGLVTRQINTVNMMWSMKKTRQIVPPDVQSKLDRRAAEMVGALRKCWNDAAVKTAFARMKLPKEPEKK